ncbi:MAG: mechanosensitive ion channel family protein, partial [Burkholderiales bacterium]
SERSIVSMRLTCRWNAGGTAALLAMVLGIAGAAFAAPGDTAASSSTEAGVLDADLPSAPVQIDGRTLFRVWGMSAFPAEDRAAAIVGRIDAFAGNADIPADVITTTEIEGGTAIFAGATRLMTLVDADAALESADRKVLAGIIASSIRDAVIEYRRERSREILVKDMVRAGIATAILAALITLVPWLTRKLETPLERRYQRRIKSLSIQSFQVVRSDQIRKLFHKLIRIVCVTSIFVVSYFYLQYVLGLLPWTRGVSNQLLSYVVNPLRHMGSGMAAALPDLIILAIIVFVTRYLLTLTQSFFRAIGRGDIAFSGFDRDLADPTYKLVRLGAIIFAVVVAYPYVPGSGTEAFKGVSIFIGILFSLGSSSAISNFIAGYLITYRRAFKVGDRVKIGNTIGDVTASRMQVTHLKTVKNEEVIIPNSTILNTEVVNYSALARDEGLILHTTVGIGYETPWRQVEAMLLLAAERTPGLGRETPPFVLQKALRDFAVTYEINVYCKNAQTMQEVYTALHRNMLDVFNEYGVQIMTPAYVGDPEQPKVVPKDRWFSTPAKREDSKK